MNSCSFTVVVPTNGEVIILISVISSNKNKF
jgi:hypothetical protein